MKKYLITFLAICCFFQATIQQCREACKSPIGCITEDCQCPPENGNDKQSEKCNICIKQHPCKKGTGQCRCEDGIFNLVNDFNHCGSCKRQCKFGQKCEKAVCVCLEGLSDCSLQGDCVDLKKDRENCGECGKKCLADETCKEGICEKVCAAGTQLCSGVCVNLSSDRLNCGQCEVKCLDNEVCQDGNCTICSAGLELCSGVCVNLSSNQLNCGKCDNACLDTEACCDSNCIAMTSTSCGCTPIACDINETCSKGVCVCLEGFERNSDNICTCNNQVCGNAILTLIGNICCPTNYICVDDLCACPIVDVTVNCTREQGDCTGTISEYLCNPNNQSCVDNQCKCNEGYTTLSDGSCVCSSNVVCGSTCCLANYVCVDGLCSCAAIDVTVNCIRKHGDCTGIVTDYLCDTTNQTCINNQCICNEGYTTLPDGTCTCPSSIICGATCCPANYVCTDGLCTCPSVSVTVNCVTETRDCNGATTTKYECDPANQTCINNQCICNQGYTTLQDGSCFCPSNVLCGATCCPANYICFIGSCLCPRFSTMVNCVTTTIDCNGALINSEHHCNPNTQTCINNQCVCNEGYVLLPGGVCTCPSTVVCGTKCCPTNYVCNDGLCTCPSVSVTVNCVTETRDCNGATTTKYECNPANQTCINNQCICNQGYTTLQDGSCFCPSNVICGTTCCPTNNYLCNDGACACPTINTIENCTVIQGDCNSTTSAYQCDPSTQYCSGSDNKCLCNPGYSTLGGNSCLCTSGITCGNTCCPVECDVNGGCVCPPEFPINCFGECRASCPGVSFGANSFRKLGTTAIANGGQSTTPIAIQHSGSSFVQLDGSYAFSIGLTNTNDLYYWGNNVVSNSDPYLPPWLMSATTKFQQACAGGTFVLALSTAGIVHSYGQGYYGELGTGNTNPVTQISPISLLLPLSQISCGYEFSLALAPDGTLYTWGKNDKNQLGRTTSGPINPIPAPIGNFSLKFKQISAGEFHSCGIALSDRIYCWGSSGLWLGTGYQLVNPIIKVENGVEVVFKQVAADNSVSMGLSENGKVYVWGIDAGRGPLSGTNDPTEVPGLPANIVKIAVGLDSCFALDATGNVYAWGLNNSGQLGYGDTLAKTSPVLVSGGKYLDVFGGRVTSYAI